MKMHNVNSINEKEEMKPPKGEAPKTAFIYIMFANTLLQNHLSSDYCFL